MVKTLEETKKEAIQNALANNKTVLDAAKALGVSRATLYRMIKKYDIMRGGKECLN